MFLKETDPIVESDIIDSFIHFFTFLSDKFDQLNQRSQFGFITCIITLTSNHDNCPDLLKQLFKSSLQHNSSENLSLFFENFEKIKHTDLIFICRQFAKISANSDKFSNLYLLFLDSIVKIASKNSEIITSELFIAFHVISRLYLKKNVVSSSSSLKCAFQSIFKMLPIVKKSFPEQHIKYCNEVYSFLLDNPTVVDEIFEELTEFHIEMFTWDVTGSPSPQRLINTYPKIFQKFMEYFISTGGVGQLLTTSNNTQNESLFEIYLNHRSRYRSTSTLCIKNCDLFVIETAARLFPVSSADIFDSLLQNCSRTLVIPDLKLQTLHRNLIRLFLLSRSSEELGDLIQRRSSITCTNLCLISHFPFSLWKSVDKNSFCTRLSDELIFFWKFIITNTNTNNNNNSLDLLFLIISSISNILTENPDSIKSENSKLILTLLPLTITSLRTTESGTKHALTVALQKLLRSLLLLRDDKVFEIIDHIAKLGSIDSSTSFADSWTSLSLFSFVKHARDSNRLNSLASQRFDMLATKLFDSIEISHVFPKILLFHHCRRSIQLFMKYTLNVNFFNKPILRNEVEKLRIYAQGFIHSWSKGNFNYCSEESIWRFIRDRKMEAVDPEELNGRSACIHLNLTHNAININSSSSSILGLLKHDLNQLSNLVERLHNSQNDSALEALHNSLKNILQ